MRRSYTAEAYLERVAALRDAVPDVSITTDLIVGFPGETEEDFAATLDVVREARFDGAFTFVYSAREGTAAAALPGQVPDDVRRERVERLVDAHPGRSRWPPIGAGSVAGPRSSSRARAGTATACADARGRT